MSAPSWAHSPVGPCHLCSTSADALAREPDLGAGRFIMQSELDFTGRWRVALTVLLVSALTGGVIFRIVTSRGPSWVFYAISAGVLALVAIDMWDKLRAARALLRATANRLGASQGQGLDTEHDAVR